MVREKVEVLFLLQEKQTIRNSRSGIAYFDPCLIIDLTL